MTISLASIANALVVVANALPAAVTAAEDIYKFGADMIVAAESAYDSTTGSGATKKAAVMAALKAFVTALNQDFSTIEKQISAWIDMVIAAYRTASTALTGLTSGTSTSAALAAAVQAGVAAAASITGAQTNGTTQAAV